MKRHIPWLVLVCSCASSPQTRIAETSAASMTVAGSRCTGGACTCRSDVEGGPADEGAIAPGHKRFEVRTGHGVDPLRVTVEGRGTLVKSTEVGHGECAYIDLPPGRHAVRLHAQARNPDAGMAPAFGISEYGADTHSWYDTFRFECGQNEPCTKDDLREFISSVGQHRRGILDPCGSVKIEHVRWSSDRSPGARLEDLDLELVLNVYPFAPRWPHGAGQCKGVSTIPTDEQ
jgi:hypothetical protein